MRICPTRRKIARRNAWSFSMNTTTPAQQQEEKVIEEDTPTLTIEVKSTTNTNSVLPAESDDLDEFESFLDSTCRSAASLESAVDNELTQHELLREKEIDAHIDALMEDL